jgi:cytochrome c biogenesis protein CcdA/thiol-disulfide isomerase/thioredoxin
VILLIAFVGGVLTICSPCILPVVPLVFARGTQSLVRVTLPTLAGLALALAFTIAASIAAATANWLLVVNEIGRYAALLLLALVGLSLLSDRLAARLAAPVSRAGARLLGLPREDEMRAPARHVIVGAAIGLLWAPCAGPILGLLIALAAGSGALHSAALYLTVASGAVMSLALLTAFGSRLVERLRSAGLAESVVRRTLGVATILTVLVIGGGWDRELVANQGLLATASAEETILRRYAPSAERGASSGISLDELSATEATNPRPITLATSGGTLPSLDGGTEWLNSSPLTAASLRRKVVLVDFWTFACYNCLNALPHVKQLYDKYKDRGFVVVGVHTPELAHERVVANVRRAVQSLDVRYPVVVDNDMRIWRAFHNQHWPAAYFADASGQLRFYHFGEGRYDEQEQVVVRLLDERDAAMKLSAARHP